MYHVYQVSIPVRPDICHRGCAYNVQKYGVCSAACGTVHYKEIFKSLEIRVLHSPASGFHLSRYSHDCAENDVKQYPQLIEFRDMYLQISTYFLS